MPTNDLTCRKCGHQEEQRYRLEEGPDRDCPECGTPSMEITFNRAPSGRVENGTPTFHQRGGGD